MNDKFDYLDSQLTKMTEETFERYINKCPVRLLSSQHVNLFIPESINQNSEVSRMMEWVNIVERIYINNNGILPDKIILENGSQSFECIIRLRYKP